MNSYLSKRTEETVAVIEVHGVTKRLEQWDVLQDVSFSVEEGEIIGVIGPSGCGKSTLLSLLAGHLLPDKGEILLEGKQIKKHMKEIALMPQSDMLFEWYTVLDNVTLPLVINGMGRKEARNIAIPYFAEFGLEGFQKAYPSKLSGGMRSRAAMLRTVLSKAKIMLLDEPFGALDALTRASMQDFLAKEARKFGISMVLVTHDAEEALYLCDRIMILGEYPAKVIGEVEGGRTLGREWLVSEQCARQKRKLMRALSDRPAVPLV